MYNVLPASHHWLMWHDWQLVKSCWCVLCGAVDESVQQMSVFHWLRVNRLPASSSGPLSLVTWQVSWWVCSTLLDHWRPSWRNVQVWNYERVCCVLNLRPVYPVHSTMGLKTSMSMYWPHWSSYCNNTGLLSNTRSIISQVTGDGL